MTQPTAHNRSATEQNYDVTQFTSTLATDDEILNCFVHLPAQQGNPFILNYDTIAAQQEQDAELAAIIQRNDPKFVRMQFGPETHLWCYIKEPDAPWKIYVPTNMLPDAIQWYHMALSHAGASRMYDTISMHFYNRHLKNKIEEFVSHCDACQRQKLAGRGYGHTAPREAELMPWREVAVDCIGPWTLKVGGHELRFKALTITDTVTNLTEIIRLQSDTAAHAALQFVNTWLSRYPKPMNLIHDRGTEFIGEKFQLMLRQQNIYGHCITTKNPQANAVAERMHQAVGNSLRVLAELNPPEGIAEANQLVDTALANAVYATRATFNSSIGTTPGAMAFSRDMVLDIPVIADLETIRENRQQLIDDRLINANRRRIAFDYMQGEQVLKLRFNPRKLDPRADGPYTIERVHTNGTLTIRISPHKIERISIRRVRPYRT